MKKGSDPLIDAAKFYLEIASKFGKEMAKNALPYIAELYKKSPEQIHYTSIMISPEPLPVRKDRARD